MLRQDELIAFVSTTDLARSRAFYEDALGLTLLDQSEFANVFDANGTMLRVTLAAVFSPAPFTVLGWGVKDIEESVQSLLVRGIDPRVFPGLGQDAAGIWTTPNGDRIAWFQDPDGNTLSLTEFRAH